MCLKKDTVLTREEVLLAVGYVASRLVTDSFITASSQSNHPVAVLSDED